MWQAGNHAQRENIPIDAAEGEIVHPVPEGGHVGPLRKSTTTVSVLGPAARAGVRSTEKGAKLRQMLHQQDAVQIDRGRQHHTVEVQEELRLAGSGVQSKCLR